VQHLLSDPNKSSQRFYSMSAQIRQERADYHDILERTQKATMDITPWMDWFLQCPGPCHLRSRSYPRNRACKARFWDTLGDCAE
jgi:hypothetical protein